MAPGGRAGPVTEAIRATKVCRNLTLTNGGYRCSDSRIRQTALGRQREFSALSSGHSIGIRRRMASAAIAPPLSGCCRRAGDRLCLQLLETGRRCRDLLGAWTTGSRGPAPDSALRQAGRLAGGAWGHPLQVLRSACLRVPSPKRWLILRSSVRVGSHRLRKGKRKLWGPPRNTGETSSASNADATCRANA